MFTYEPLDAGSDSLRVLTLLPSPQGGVIECTLENRTFRSKPDYEALSYTWGTKPESTHITINGEPFPVRENLYNALKNLKVSKPRPLWVDAVCINQEDVTERNAQVSLMAFIYTRARRVLAWLGPWAEEVRSGYFSDANWHVFSHNPYWTRLWIIQELVLANDVRFHLGRHSFGWKQVTSTQNPEWKALEGRAETIHTFRGERYTSAQRLENLIEVFQKAQCTDKRDKIFGLLGMVLDGSDSVIKVDYEVSFAQLYAQVIDFQQTTSAATDSPFSNDIDRAARLIRFSQLLQRIMKGAVGNDVTAKPEPTWPSTFYIARGCIAAEILCLGPTPSEVTSSIKADKAWKFSFTRALDDRDEVQKARRDYEAFSRMMMDWSDSYLGEIKASDSSVCYGFQGADPGPQDLTREGAADSSNNSGARLMLGSSGRVGVVPHGTQEGDYVCTFLGCNIAAVVRKLTTASDLFQVVGPARIYQEEREWETDEDKEIETAIAYDMEGLSHGNEESEALLSEAGINLRLDLETLQKLTAFS